MTALTKLFRTTTFRLSLSYLALFGAAAVVAIFYIYWNTTVLLTRQLHSLVLDLSGLEYISSAGIRSIFKARKTLAPHGGKVLLVNPQPQIQKVLDMVKAVPLNEIFSSTAEADAYLDLMQRRVLEAGEDDD